MNNVIIIILILSIYYITSFENKGIPLLVLLISLYLYYNNYIPTKYLKLPIKNIKEKDDTKYNFIKLDRLINDYNKSNKQNEKSILNKINREVKIIYFSFPNHLHHEIDYHLQFNYNIKKI